MADEELTRPLRFSTQIVSVNRDRKGHRHNSTLLLRRGKEPKSLFGELHLLPLLLPLLLQCRK
jgi:hypothetical protein